MRKMWSQMMTDTENRTVHWFVNCCSNADISQTCDDGVAPHPDSDQLSSGSNTLASAKSLGTLPYLFFTPVVC